MKLFQFKCLLKNLNVNISLDDIMIMNRVMVVLDISNLEWLLCQIDVLSTRYFHIFWRWNYLDPMLNLNSIKLFWSLKWRDTGHRIKFRWYVKNQTHGTECKFLSHKLLWQHITLSPNFLSRLSLRRLSVWTMFGSSNWEIMQRCIIRTDGKLTMAKSKSVLQVGIFFLIFCFCS